MSPYAYLPILLLDDKVKALYDFLYLPIDFTNGCNMGYAFVNMVDEQAIVKLHGSFQGSRWPKFRSSKVSACKTTVTFHPNPQLTI